MQREVAGRHASRHGRRARTWIGVAVVVAALALALPLLPSVSAGSYGPGTVPSWTNDLVLCEFSPTSPLVAVSAFGISGGGLDASAMSMTEVAPNGSAMASADFASATWTLTNESDDDAYELAYSSDVPLESGGVAALSHAPSVEVGVANLSIDFVLPAYDGSPDGPTNVVTMGVSVNQWTWLSSEDHLVLTLGAELGSPSAGQLVNASAAGWLLTSAPTGAGAAVEQFGANDSAIGSSRTGANVSVSASPTVAQSTSSSAIVSIVFGTQAGAFTSLSFSARVGVVLPSTVAGVPIAYLAAAGVAGLLVSALVAVSARRVRQRPSKLIYVTEEEQR